MGIWDSERQPIDTIVFHHTSLPTGVTLEELSALQRERLYVPFYQALQKEGLVYSGHVQNGSEVFYAYHWLVRADGKTERLLHDTEIGWHAGNWETNRRSIGICFDGNYEDSQPSTAALKSAAAIIKNNYFSVPKERIIGHCEVKEGTVCPSGVFLSQGDTQGWKEKLLTLL
jgi:N-acetyl-anhydromuramyl-L-alanine amidase AmpD